MITSLIASLSSLIEETKNQSRQEKELLDTHHLTLNTFKNKITLLGQTFPLPEYIYKTGQEWGDLEKQIARIKEAQCTLENSIAQIKVDLDKKASGYNEELAKKEEAEKLRYNYAATVLQCDNHLQHIDALYLVKTMRADVHDDLGKSVSPTYQMMNYCEDQGYVIEKQIENITSCLLARSQDFNFFHEESMRKLKTIQEDLKNISLLVSKFKMSLLNLECHIVELNTLQKIYNEKSLHGAAARGDMQETIKLLATSISPQKVDYLGHKPIYYACYFGQALMAVKLMDITKLSTEEKNELLDIFPKHKKEESAFFYSAIQCKDHYSFDYIWDEKDSIGNNIARVFKDYYSPTFLEPFLPDELGHILSFNFLRSNENIELAKKGVDLMTRLEPADREDIKLCKRLFEGKWNAYFKKANASEDDGLARRFFYLNKRLNVGLNPDNQLKDLSDNNPRVRFSQTAYHFHYHPSSPPSKEKNAEVLMQTQSPTIK